MIGIFLGLCLMAGGQVILANDGRAAAFVGRSLGRVGATLASFMMETFQPGVALGLGLLILGALFVATVVGLPSLESGAPPEATGEAEPRASVLRVAPGHVAVAVVLAVASVVALSRSNPGMVAVILWLGALAALLLVATALDRVRLSRIGSPFDRRWEWVLLLGLMAAELILVAHDLTHYRWAGLPDESSFFVAAKGMANGHLRLFLLSEDGVFGYHPVLSSAYQAAFLKVLGTNIFSWRLSSAVALAISLPFVYLFTREIWSRRAGVIAAVLFGTAQLAVGFAHFGYNNVQVYPVIFASLAVLAVAIRCRSVAGHYLAGLIAGMGFYTFYTARLAPLLAILLVWSLGRLSLKRAGVELGALVVGVILGVLPLLIHPATLAAHMLQQTAFTGDAGSGSAGWRGLAFLSLPGGAPLLKVWSHWL